MTRDEELLDILISLCEDLAWGRPADEDKLYALTGEDWSQSRLSRLAEAFGLMLIKLEIWTIQANHDALTGIYNRRFIEKNFRKIMDFLSRSNGFLSVLMLDVDFFKKYNDTYGHVQGDACLKAIARTLSSSVTRGNDFVARYGGEEFIAVLPNTNEASVRMIAEKLLKNVRELNIPHADSAAASDITVSIGATTGQVVHTQSWIEYVKRADEALYMSKQHGRNQYTFLDYSDKPAVAELREALLDKPL